MRLTTVLIMTVLAVCGCATPQSGIMHDRKAAEPVDVGIDWGWDVGGDAAVRPVQVFSVDGMTYLQMRQGHEPVALLLDGAVGNYRVYPPYLVVYGAPDRIDIVSDGYRAVVRRITKGPGARVTYINK